MLNYALSFMALGAGLFALESSSLIPANFKKYILFSGITIFFVGLILLICWKVQMLSKGTRFLIDKVSSKATEFFNYEYDCQNTLLKIANHSISDCRVRISVLFYRFALPFQPPQQFTRNNLAF
jgi:hypothetical protein